MTAAIYDSKTIKISLLLQLITFVFMSILFGIYDFLWAGSAFLGGLAAWLSAIAFILCTWWHRSTEEKTGRIAWFFALGEVLKVTVTIVLLLVALSVFKAKFVPLCVTYLFVLVVQIVAPAVINNKG